MQANSPQASLRKTAMRVASSAEIAKGTERECEYLNSDLIMVM